MKIARVPAAQGEVLVVMHNLGIHEARFRKFRPVHVLTHVAQFHKSVVSKGDAFGLGLTLENKLYAVTHYATQLCEAVTPLSVPLYEGHYVTEYEPTQRVVAIIEGYIGAVYSTLEVVALLNKCFDRSLPQGFRRQAKKVEVFALAKHEWLRHFFDVRSEFAHYNSPLPIVAQQKLIVNFRNPSDLEHFKKGLHEIEFRAILAYAPALFDMLDAWAFSHFGEIDRDASLNVFHETGWKKPLESKSITVAQLLAEVGA